MVDRYAVKERKAERKAKSVVEQRLEDLGKIEVSPEESVLFFLGAGASKPPPSSIPTVSELLTELWKKSNQMENKPLSKLEQWCKENRIDNIEEMLTGVTLSDFMIRNRKVHNLLNSVLYPEWGSLKDLSIRDVETVSSFQNMIDTFFSLLVGTMLNAQPNPTHEAIVNFVNSFKNTGIVTTNYDVCMDQALDNAKIEYSYVIGSQKSQSTMPLIKMHGSINWFYCQTCQHVLMPTVENMRKAIENQMPYSVTGMCPECNSPTKQFIVPPTTYKFLIYPPIVQVWNAGREIFEHSKFYIIVGYSFGLGDDYILKMVLKAIREDPKKQLIIIDKSIETLERFKLLVTTHTVGFPETNLHSIPASAETVVPKVVDILLKRKAKKKTEKVKKTI
jgi:NAD-dependent SIR2 family protein deacetylase